MKSNPTLEQTTITKQNITEIQVTTFTNRTASAKKALVKLFDANAPNTIVVYVLSHQLSISNVNKPFESQN